MKLSKLFISLSFFFVAITSHAEEIKIKSFSMLMDPMTTDIQRKDNNGQICALVKVACPADGVSFKGSVVSNERVANEYFVSLTPGTRFLQLHVPGYLPKMVDFQDYDIKGVMSRRIYYLEIELPPLQQIHVEPLIEECMRYYYNNEYKKAQECAINNLNLNGNEGISVRLKEIINKCDTMLSNIALYNDRAKNLNQLSADPIMHSPGIFRYKKQCKMGTCDIDGNSIVTAVFEMIHPVDKDRYWVLNEKGWHIIDQSGRHIADCEEVKECWETSCMQDYDIEPGMVVNYTDKKSGLRRYGVMDRRSGKWMLPMEYDKINVSSYGYIGSNSDSKKITVWNLSTGSGEEITLPGYFASHLGYGKIKISSKKSLPSSYWSEYEHSGVYGICDVTGKIVLPMKYKSIIGDTGESVVLEEHEKVKLGWLRHGHLYNIKYDTMLIENLGGEFSYINPPIFFKNGWACHSYGVSWIINPNTGEIVNYSAGNFNEALKELGDFQTYEKGEDAKRKRDIVNKKGVEYIRLCDAGQKGITTIERVSDHRLGFEDIEGNIMFGD